MFLENKYTRIYFAIIEKYKKIDMYDAPCEIHHIIPKSFGGSNDVSNLVKLPIKAHYICHHLLIYMVSDKSHYEKMIHAFWRMCNTETQKQKITAKSYEKLRQIKIDIMKSKPSHWLGKKHSDHTKQKMSAAAKGRNPQEHINYVKPKIWNKGKNKENNDLIRKIALGKTGNKNVMFGRTGENHPRSKPFSLYDDLNIKQKTFYTRVQFKDYCKELGLPFDGLYKTLKGNPYLDKSNDGRHKNYNNFYIKYD